MDQKMDEGVRRWIEVGESGRKWMKADKGICRLMEVYESV